MTFTMCQDRACPQKQQCLRYDPSPLETKFVAYFARSPRVRDTCDWFASNTQQAPAPLTSDWPVDPEAGS